MRTRCRLFLLLGCLGLFLLLYFFGNGGAGNEPPPPPKQVAAEERKEEEEEQKKKKPLNSSPSPSAFTVKFEKKRQKKGQKASRKVTNVKSKQKSRAVTRGRGRGQEGMHLAVVACGNRVDETLTMVKSAVLFSLKKITFHIFAEDPLAPQFHEKLKQWPRSAAAKFHYILYPITFSVGDAEEWKKLFKPCAAQRLFLPVILKDVDSLLYVDTDVLFLRPMDDIWSFFKAFNSSQLAAMAPEHEVPKIGWYSRFARHPFYGISGVNSGVMLMNLTRIRSTMFKNSLIPGGLSWEDLLHPLYQKYKNHITWGDQDLLNIIFHYNLECLYIFPCQWNYRPDHCMYGSNCRGAEEEGVSILHGNRGVYHDDKQPAFRVMYDAIRDYPFEDNMFQSLFYPIQTKFLDTVNTLCGRIPQVFLKQIEKTMRKVFEEKVVRRARPRK